MKRSVLFSLVVIIAAMSVMTVSAASPHGRYYDQMGNKYWCNSDSYGCWVTNENGGKDYIMFWSEAAAEAIMGTNSGAPIGTFPGTSELSLEAPIPEVVVKEGSAPSPAPVDKCKDVTCQEGETCNKETGECESDTPVDKCKDVKCDEGQTCNAETGQCEAAAPVDKCKDVQCESGQTCNAETGQCEAETPVDKCKDVQCESGQTCNAETGQCEATTPVDKCKDVSCESGQTCNAETGQCEAAAVVDKCANVTCDEGKTCNSDTGQCEAAAVVDKCKDVQCESGQTCNADTGFCETASGGMGSCTTNDDCESGYACLVSGLGGTCTRTTGWTCDANSCPAAQGMSCNEYNWCLKTSCTEEDKAVVGNCAAPKSYKVVNLSCTCAL